MAASFDLLLVSNTAENPADIEAASAVIAALIPQRGGIVSSDLSKDSVSLLTSAFALQRFDAFLDTQWDPPKTKNSIYDYQLLSNDELCSFANEMNATFETIDFDNYAESEEVYKLRIRASLFMPARCLRVVVVNAVVIETCMHLMGQKCDLPPLLSLWKVWPETQKGTLLKQVEDWANWQEIVSNLPTNSLSSLSIHQSVVLTSYEARRPIDPSTFAATEQLLQEQVQQLSGEVNSALGREMKSVLHAYCEEGFGPAEETAKEVNDSLKGLKHKFGETLQKLEERLREVDGYKQTKKAEIGEVTREMRNIAAYQDEVSDLLQRMEESLSPTIADLQARLAAFDIQQAALIQEINTAQENKLASAFPLNIRKISRLPDNHYQADIVNRKLYPVTGNLVLLNQQGVVSYTSNIIEFRGTQPLNLTDIIGEIAPGVYQIAILHPVDASYISLCVPFSVAEEDRSHTHSLLYREKDMARLEEELRKDRGLEHVNALRRLATAWENADIEKFEEFLEVFSDRSVEGEEALKARLRAQGFRV